MYLILFLLSYLLLCNSIKLTNTKLLCKNCKQYYYKNQNTNRSCKVHKGKFIGAELSKHVGTRSGGLDKGLALFWDCCNATDPLALGCHTYYHISYDDDNEEENNNYLVNNYKFLKS